MKHCALIALILLPLTLSQAQVLGPTPTGVPAVMPTAAGALIPQGASLPQSTVATPTPGADESHRLYLPLVLKKAWLVKIVVYPGPSNVDYGPGIELPPCIEYTPVGKYSDFVKVQWRDEGGALKEGFVWVALLRELPEDLPVLSKDEVPWVEQEFITPEKPIEFLTSNINYNLYVVPGSINRVQEDVEIEAAVERVEFDEEAPDTSSVEISFDNGFLEGENLRRLVLRYLKGESAKGWNIAYLKRQVNGQDEWDFFYNLGIFDGDLRFRLRVDREGRNATLQLLDEEGNVTRQIGKQLSEPLYSATDIMGLTVVSGPQSAIEISELVLSQAPDGEYQEIETQETLRSLADAAGITIGTAAEAWTMTAEPREPYDMVYRDILRAEFNQLTPEGNFNWTWLLRPAPDTYNFAYPDLLIDFANTNNMRVRAYLLPSGNFPEQGGLPDWLVSGNYSSDELREIVEDHIHTVVSRYRGKVQEWTVFGETIWDGQFVEDNFWRQQVAGGDISAFEDFIADVYQYVKTTDPDGKTTYNFVIYHFPDRGRVERQLDAVYEHLGRLRAKGAPIDALGIEMHLRPAVYEPNKEEVIADMQRFSELGLEVIVMEMDVNMYGIEGTEEERQAFQAQIYRDMVEACIESGVCPNFTMWGVKLPFSWLLGPDYPYGPAETYLLFDEEGNPNVSYFALRDALRAAASQP